MKYELTLDKDFDLLVGAHTVHVKFVDASHHGFDDRHHGSWVHSKYTIFIKKDDPYSMRLSTFIHELLHVFEDFYSIEISHQDLNLAADVLAQVLLANFTITSSRRKKR